MRSLRNSIGTANDLGRTLQGYESLKSNLIEFPCLDHKRSISIADPSIKSLKLKLTEMETLVKLCRERIKLLEKTVADLSVQSEKLQQVNKALISEKLDLSSPDISYFLQDIIINDIKKQLEEAHSDIEKHRLDSERMKKKYEAIVQENRRIEGSIKRYRKMITQNTSNRFIPVDLHSTDEELSTKRSSESSRVHNDKSYIKSYSSLDSVIKEMTESPNLISLFNKLCTTCKTLLPSSKVSLYILSPDLQRFYIKYFQSAQHVQKVLLGNTWIQVHTDPSCDVIEPVFSKIDEMLQNHKSCDKLIQQIQVFREPSMIVQCLSGDKGFDNHCEKILNVLSHVVCGLTRLILSSDREKNLKRQLVDIVEVSAGIAKSRNRQSLAHAVHYNLPKFFECESAGIVFIDEENKESYTMAYSSEPNQLFSQDIIRFPINMGLTGETYKNKGFMIFDNVKKRNLYNPEIDNIAGTPDLNLSLMSCCLGPNNGIFAVLQLGNKSGGFSKKELQTVTNFSSILGYMTAGIFDISEAMDLTIKIKEYLSNLNSVLKADISELSPDSSGIVDQLEIIKSVVFNWSKKKKAKMLSMK